MAVKPFTKEEFGLLNGERTGANSIYQRLLVLRYEINEYLKERDIEFSGVVALPALSQNTDVRRAGWLGYIQPDGRLPDATLNPLSAQPSVSVLVMGQDNWRGEEAGLQVVLEFGENKRCIDQRTTFRQFLMSATYLNLAYLGKEMALRMRGLPETTTPISSQAAVESFLSTHLKRFDAERNYAVIGRFFSVGEASALGESQGETISEAVRRLLKLMYGFISGKM